MAWKAMLQGWGASPPSPTPQQLGTVRSGLPSGFFDETPASNLPRTPPPPPPSPRPRLMLQNIQQQEEKLRRASDSPSFTAWRESQQSHRKSLQLPRMFLQPARTLLSTPHMVKQRTTQRRSSGSSRRSSLESNTRGRMSLEPTLPENLTMKSPSLSPNQSPTELVTQTTMLDDIPSEEVEQTLPMHTFEGQRRRSSGDDSIIEQEIQKTRRRSKYPSPEVGAPLLWKTSRGPMAREPPPRRRSSTPAPLHSQLLPQQTQPQQTQPQTQTQTQAQTQMQLLPELQPQVQLQPQSPPKRHSIDVPRVAPARVLYAAALERYSKRKEASVHTMPLPHVISSINVAWAKDAIVPVTSVYHPEPKIAKRRHRKSKDSQVQGPDQEELEERELQLLELNPQRDPEVEREQERHLIQRGRRAYKRLMAGETKSMQDIYKMMLELAWRHRNDPVPPPLPPPPPPEASRPPPRVQLMRPKVRKLPLRPARPIEALPSDETFYAAAAERAMTGTRRSSLEGTTSGWNPEARRSGTPRPSIDLRPSVLLDPASWAPPDAGRRLSDPRAPPPPGRVPRGWINIMEIGAPT